MNIEERATQLESELKSGQFSKVSDDLYRESMQNPGEFNNLVKKFGEKNAADRNQNCMLPALEIHEEGNDVQKFFGLSQVDKVGVKTSMLVDSPEPQGDLWIAPAKQVEIKPEPMQSSEGSIIQGMNNKQQDSGDLLHIAGNIFSSVFDGLQHGNTSKINRNENDNEVRTYNGQVLPKAGFGNW